MNLAFYIARRYLFAKKSHHAINIISMVSVCGVVVATIAMICTLSVYNGFKGLTTTLFSVFDPDLKIAAVEGKVFDPTTETMQTVCTLPEIQHYCGVLQENAIIRYGGHQELFQEDALVGQSERQEISVLKGVDSTFRHLVLIDSAIIDGQFILSEADVNNEDVTYYGILGRGLAYTLGVNAAFSYPLEIFIPDRTGNVNMANPLSAIKLDYVYIGGLYHVNQPIYDDGFMLLSIDLLRSMLGYEKEVSALEIKLVPDADINTVKKKIRQLIGDGFTVKDRYEQQEAAFKVFQIEKWVTFLMLCFILILALFNVLGSLAILMIEKEEDVSKLRSMGADNRLINRIFLFEGWMISLLGAMIGVAIGIGLCFLQQQFGLIKLGETAGTFIVDAYPVEVVWTDVCIVLLTVMTIGFLAVLYPVHYLGRKRLLKELACGLLLPLIMISCGGQKKDSRDGEKKEIAVTIEPIGYFAQKIAGDDYTFFPVVPFGRSPETYDPSFREILKVEKSEAYFHINRLGLEQILIKSVQQNQKAVKLFDLSEGDLPELPCDGEGENPDAVHTHHHGYGSHVGHDPHIWTSFSGAKVMSENICKALSSLNKSKAGYYQANYQRLTDELDLLENELHQQLDTLSCRGFVIYHPALSYFAKEFDLVQYSMEEDGKDPSPATLKRLIEEARSAQVKVVFVQLEFDSSYAKQIAAEIGARIVTINPLDYQWDVQMRRMAQALVTNGEVD